MRGAFPIIDTHTHIGAAGHTRRSYSAEQLLRDMDRNGVDRSVVIPFPIVENMREAHDEVGRAVRAWPDRLIGAACLYRHIPVQDFREELRRCRNEYGFRALKFQPQYHCLNPLSEESGFLFESALEYQMALICHTGPGVPFSLPSLFMPAAREYPRLRIVLAHAGGGGIFHSEAIVAALFCPNIYLELSTLLPHQLLEVLDHIPSDRLMIGSDLPENLNLEIGKILDLDIREKDKRNILSQVAESVFSGC